MEWGDTGKTTQTTNIVYILIILKIEVHLENIDNSVTGHDLKIYSQVKHWRILKWAP